jgi:hypothetical protein
VHISAHHGTSQNITEHHRTSQNLTEPHSSAQLSTAHHSTQYQANTALLSAEAYGTAHIGSAAAQQLRRYSHLSSQRLPAHKQVIGDGSEQHRLIKPQRSAALITFGA